MKSGGIFIKAAIGSLSHANYEQSNVKRLSENMEAKSLRVQVLLMSSPTLTNRLQQKFSVASAVLADAAFLRYVGNTN